MEIVAFIMSISCFVLIVLLSIFCYISIKKALYRIDWIIEYSKLHDCESVTSAVVDYPNSAYKGKPIKEDIIKVEKQIESKEFH